MFLPFVLSSPLFFLQTCPKNFAVFLFLCWFIPAGPSDNDLERSYSCLCFNIGDSGSLLHSLPAIPSLFFTLSKCLKTTATPSLPPSFHGECGPKKVCCYFLSQSRSSSTQQTEDNASLRSKE